MNTINKINVNNTDYAILSEGIELTEKKNGTNVTVFSNNNVNIEPREALLDGAGNAGTANAKGGNIALKPGDDIEMWAHHRGTSKNDEVSIKILTETEDGDEVPAKLQLNCNDIVITSKDKTKDSDVMNITFNKKKSTRGYLKVRAQAIDLRCEEHGGIAIQPKGKDGEGNMNKIKFEHGGGDGLEFGTFNTERTSLFTDEYRFNKDGVIKIATRQTMPSDKADGVDDTTALKYVKQEDDFYDIISPSDPTCTWEDIVRYISWAKSNKQGPWAAA